MRFVTEGHAHLILLNKIFYCNDSFTTLIKILATVQTNGTMMELVRSISIAGLIYMTLVGSCVENFDPHGFKN